MCETLLYQKVCIVGTESCGKTTLVHHLAQYFNTTHVIEAGRYICDAAGGIDNMQPYHYFDILIKHKELENKALQNANKVLLIDTDALVTLYYYQLGFEHTNEKDETFEALARGLSSQNHYDLYLFLKPDVKWVQDGTRTYGEESIRKENHRKLKKILDENHIPYFFISGDYNERYEQAKKMIKNIIN